MTKQAWDKIFQLEEAESVLIHPRKNALDAPAHNASEKQTEHLQAARITTADNVIAMA